MPSPTSTARLLLELERGTVAAERYSRASLFARCEPMLLTSALAAAAVLTGVALGSLRAPRV